MPNVAPIPRYPSRRLIGIELEVDAGSTKLNLPQHHPGWTKQTDGSLRNGYEFILNPPLPLESSSDTVKNFLDALDKARANTTKRGGLHVHVQAHDYDSHFNDAFSLVRLYTHFQEVINSLVGKSRVGNQYCPAYRANVTKREVIDMFSLNMPASGRGDAKSSRAYSVVNLAMLRCRNPHDRTVEFRQGSPSKRFECVWGWASLMVCLVDMAKEPVVMTHELMEQRPTLENFIELIKFHEARVGSTDVGNWVKWRYDYMNEAPTEELIVKAVACIGRTPRGLFHISRQLEINLALAGRVMEAAEQRQLVSSIRSYEGEGAKKYSAHYRNWAGNDLATIEEAALARSRVAPPGALPPGGAPAPTPAEPSATEHSVATVLTEQEQRDAVQLNEAIAGLAPGLAGGLEERENQV